MSSGLPVIASDIPGVKEVIEPGYSGIITKSGDVKSLSEVINKMIENPTLRGEIGTTARKTILDHFTWPAIAVKLEKYMLEVSNLHN
jgi:glycosyltransferase involved in cell wall biosynthesis